MCMDVGRKCAVPTNITMAQKATCPTSLSDFSAHDVCHNSDDTIIGQSPQVVVTQEFVNLSFMCPCTNK